MELLRACQSILSLPCLNIYTSIAASCRRWHKMEKLSFYSTCTHSHSYFLCISKFLCAVKEQIIKALEVKKEPHNHYCK